MDDLAHVSEIVHQEEPKIGDVRRLSGILRRILIYDDLRKVAAPRIGRIRLRSPDVRAVHRLNERTPLILAFADHVNTCGIEAFCAVVEKGDNPSQLNNFNPEEFALLQFDAFCNQRVICLDGTWASRADVIKYVANIASGVHTTDPKDPTHHLLRKVRNQFVMKIVGEAVEMQFDPQKRSDNDPALSINRDGLDMVLLSFIATGQHLVASPDVMRLIAEINIAG